MDPGAGLIQPQHKILGFLRQADGHTVPAASPHCVLFEPQADFQII